MQLSHANVPPKFQSFEVKIVIESEKELSMLTGLFARDTMVPDYLIRLDKITPSEKDMMTDFMQKVFVLLNRP